MNVFEPRIYKDKTRRIVSTNYSLQDNSVLLLYEQRLGDQLRHFEETTAERMYTKIVEEALSEMARNIRRGRSKVLCKDKRGRKERDN